MMDWDLVDKMEDDWEDEWSCDPAAPAAAADTEDETATLLLKPAPRRNEGKWAMAMRLSIVGCVGSVRHCGVVIETNSMISAIRLVLDCVPPVATLAAYSRSRLLRRRVRWEDDLEEHLPWVDNRLAAVACLVDAALDFVEIFLALKSSYAVLAVLAVFVRLATALVLTRGSCTTDASAIPIRDWLRFATFVVFAAGIFFIAVAADPQPLDYVPPPHPHHHYDSSGLFWNVVKDSPLHHRSSPSLKIMNAALDDRRSRLRRY